MKIPAFIHRISYIRRFGMYIFVFLLVLAIGFTVFRIYGKYAAVKTRALTSESQLAKLTNDYNSVKKELTDLQSQDQLLRNNQLEEEINSIKSTYNTGVTAYEEMLKLRDGGGKIISLEPMFTQILILLAQRDWKQAGEKIQVMRNTIAKIRSDMAALQAPSLTAPASNTAPQGGYSRQSVTTDKGQFVVDLIAGDLSTTRALVDSASDADCKTDCPVVPLADYVSRNGGYAGINGSYFCPDTYPSCADRKNSFDTLLMNKNKKYINSANNVYSTVPAVIFLGSSVRFVAKSLEWGRDTGGDGVLANQPLLLIGGNTMFSGDDDPKKSGRGLRGFVANKGNIVYIGIVHNASVAESALALKALGMENAINLDSGGSTALWYNGYKYGPGRNIPNAIIFVRR